MPSHWRYNAVLYGEYVQIAQVQCISVQSLHTQVAANAWIVILVQVQRYFDPTDFDEQISHERFGLTRDVGDQHEI